MLGKTFTQEGVASLSGRSEAEIDPLLGSLVRKEVLSLQTDPRSPEHGQYGFLQDLVRHVAYETLSKRERRTRHLAAADVPRGEPRPRTRSQRSSPPTTSRPTRPRPTPTTPPRSGTRRARRSPAPASAPSRSRPPPRHSATSSRQPSSPTTPPRRPACSTVPGRWRGAANEPVEARALLERAQALYESRAMTRGAPRASRHGSARSTSPRDTSSRPSRGSSRRSRRSPGEEPDENVAAVAGTARTLPHPERRVGERRRRTSSKRSRSRRRSTSPRRSRRRSRARRSSTSDSDRLTEPRILLEGALAIALEHDLHSAALRAYNNLLVALDAADRISESSALNEQAIEFARRVGDRGQEAAFVGGSVGSLYLVGRWDEALLRANEASETASTTFAQSTLLDVVHLHCERGESEAARELLERFAAVGESDSDESVAGYKVFEARTLAQKGGSARRSQTAEAALAARGTSRDDVLGRQGRDGRGARMLARPRRHGQDAGAARHPRRAPPRRADPDASAASEPASAAGSRPQPAPPTPERTSRRRSASTRASVRRSSSP